MGGNISRGAGPGRFLGVAWFVCFLSAYVSLKHSFGILTCDDAFITLGHARSWLAGLGPVMSARNPVSATSTPLHTAVIALFALPLRVNDFGALSWWIDIAWDLAGVFFFYRIATRLLGLPLPFAFAALCAYALSVLALTVSAYGMETSMYTALALAGTWYRFGSPKPLPGLMAVCLLAPLTRPEGALLPGILILAGLRKDGWKRSAAYAGAAAAGFALFFAFYLMAYGHLLPHSVIAKRLEMRMGFASGLWSWVLNVFYKGPCLGGRTAVTLANLLVLLAAAAGFARRLPEAKPFPWPVLAWPGAYFLFFISTRASYVWFTWYYLPVLPFLLLAVFAGLERLADGRLGIAAWILPFALLAAITFETYRQGIPARQRLNHEAREGRYREAARILDSASVGAIPTVMFDEVGALAYFSHVKILDTHGLLSPEALPDLSGPPDDWRRMRALRLRLNPDWIMAARPTQLEGIIQPGEKEIYEGYQPVRALRSPGNPFVIEMWRRAGD